MTTINNTSTKTWPLFKYFPLLQNSLNPIALCNTPTTVEPLLPLSDKAWVKRDDQTHSLYGGNKTRKYEFLIPDIFKSKAKHVYTIGGSGTNHGVATAMVCQQHKLKSTIITFDQPDSAYVKKNQALMQHFGAKVINCGSVVVAACRFYLNPRRLSKNYYFLPGGGGTAVATFAYVNAALELKQQIENDECPEPAEIYVPVGSSSTLAGLTLGCAIAGLKTKVVGIQILESHIGPMETCTPAIGNKLMQQTIAIIRSLYPQFAIDPPPVILDTRYYEPGYGQLTDSTSQAISLAEKHGLSLEQTYSGKTFDAFTKALQSTDKPILYWATYSSSPTPELVSV